MDKSRNIQLTRAELRTFGLTMGVIVALLFGFIIPLLLDFPYTYWPWILACVFIILSIIAPGSLQPVYTGWMKFGLLMNRITTPLILGILFYSVITPIGLIMRLAGHKPMTDKFEVDKRTYFIKSQVRKKHDIERPF